MSAAASNHIFNISQSWMFFCCHEARQFYTCVKIELLWSHWALKLYSSSWACLVSKLKLKWLVIVLRFLVLWQSLIVGPLLHSEFLQKGFLFAALEKFHLLPSIVSILETHCFHCLPCFLQLLHQVHPSVGLVDIPHNISILLHPNTTLCWCVSEEFLPLAR